MLYALSKSLSSSDESGDYDIVGSLMAAGKWAVNAGEEFAFSQMLPSPMQPYADQLIQSGRQYGLSPWLLAGIMWRESNGGAALTPPGPYGTGDFTPRPSTSTWFKYADPATGLPPDGLGWGRGLMQLDYGAEHQWVTTHQWGDPATNIGYAAQKLAGLLTYFQTFSNALVSVDSWRLYGYPAANVAGWQDKYGVQSLGPYPDPRPLQGSTLYEAALAAYNAGQSGVLQAVAAGIPPSAATARNDYGTWILTHIAAWTQSAV